MIALAWNRLYYILTKDYLFYLNIISIPFCWFKLEVDQSGGRVDHSVLLLASCVNLVNLKLKPAEGKRYFWKILSHFEHLGPNAPLQNIMKLIWKKSESWYSLLCTLKNRSFYFRTFVYLLFWLRVDSTLPWAINKEEESL